MGTRYITCVKLDGEYKVSQYGGMGGHPQSAGVGCINHLKEIIPHLEKFKSQLNFVQLIPYDDEDVINTEATFVMPAHTVLKAVNETAKNIKLYPSIEYAGESSCDWVYVVDLDEEMFKVYKGKNRDISKEAPEFTQYVPKENLGYRAASLLQQYPFDKLPDIEEFKKFHDDLEKQEENE